MTRGAFAALLLLSCATPARTSSRIATAVSGVGSPRSPAPGSGPTTRSDATCVPVCESGWRCNDATAVCERLPCLGRCRSDQRCDTSGPIESCVSP